MLVFNNSQAKSRLKDRDDNPLTWRITRRPDGSHSVEPSDFALQNYLDSGKLIVTWEDAMNACCQAERKIFLEASKATRKACTMTDMARRLKLHQDSSHADAIDVITEAMTMGRINSDQFVLMQQQKLFEHRHDKNFMSTVMKNIDIEIAAELSK
jgi:hypothetical protein